MATMALFQDAISVPAVAYHPPNREEVRTITLSELLKGTSRQLPASEQGAFQFGAPTGYGATLLYLAGNRELLRRPCVAVVGTRKVSREGAARAKRLARELVEAGVVVVSGLAMGVDGEAMRSAIACGGNTIGVLGTPLDIATPSENRALQEKVYREHLLISQFPSGSSVNKGNFPRRNRVMAAISDATVIVEASDTSGTLHQARECLDLGRWLFIAASVVENSELSWPKEFLKHSKTAVLKSTSEILERILQ